MFYFIPGVLGLHLLDDLLAEAADLGGALDRHVLGTLVSKSKRHFIMRLGIYVEK